MKYSRFLKNISVAEGVINATGMSGNVLLLLKRPRDDMRGCDQSRKQRKGR